MKKHKTIYMPNHPYYFGVSGFETLKAIEKTCLILREWAAKENIDEDEVRIDIEKGYESAYDREESVVVKVCGRRLETDEEFQDRITKEKEQVEQQKQQELAEFERLKKIYEGK